MPAWKVDRVRLGFELAAYHGVSELYEITRKLDTPVAPEIRKRLGCCRWGHAGYVKEHSRPWRQELGPNAGTRPTAAAGCRTIYCKECHRAAQRTRREAEPHGG